MKPTAALIAPASLSPAEVAELDRVEHVIEQADRSFVDFGAGLAVVHDKKLYRPKTWEAYCLARWEIGDDRAMQLMEAAQAWQEIKQDLKPDKIRVFPARESHIRPLLALTRVERAKAWIASIKAAGKRRVRMQDVEAAVEAILGKPAGALPGEQSSAMAAIMSRMSPEQMEAAQALAQSQARDRPPPPARDVGGSHTDERTKAARRKLNQLLKLVSGYGGDDSDMGESLEWALAWALRILDGERPPAKWLKQKEDA